VLGGLPWVSLAVSGAQSGATYLQTDTFILTVKGAANQLVTVCQNPPCTPYVSIRPVIPSSGF
jgi:hypothetical protein